MDLVMLSRLQFAVAVFFHFIFVPLTLGLTVLLAIMETIYVRTGDETYKRMAKFWGKLFLINFALGVVTGITLEFQFGTNWSKYSAYVGDIFGSLLAIEATAAFFLESTFVAVWAFGWNKVGKKVHCFAIWAVAFASNLSAVWIIIANGFMQNPVGYAIRNGRAELENFLTVIANPYAWGQFFHTIFSSWMLAGFFVLAVCAWHLLRKNADPVFARSVKIAAPFTLVLAAGGRRRASPGADRRQVPARQTGRHGITLGNAEERSHVSAGVAQSGRRKKQRGSHRHSRCAFLHGAWQLFAGSHRA